MTAGSATDMRSSAHRTRPARRGFALVAALAGTIAFLAGCGGGNDAAHVDPFAAYLDREGIDAEVMGGGCSDALFEQNGFALWRCVVYVDGDAQTWNVAYDGQQVVDASEK